MLDDARKIYRESQKPADSLFNRYIARPPAAVVVAKLAPTRVTPNQVTFASIAVMKLAVLAFALVPTWAGLWLGILLVEASYVLDCADGQLARYTGRSSPVGGLLDFLMDEVKAFLLVGGLSIRWHLWEGGGTLALFTGILTLAVVGSAIALTKFVRTPEYAQATGTAQLKHGEAAGQKAAGPLGLVMAGARLISQYPTTLPLFALFGRMDLFLYAYGGVHVLYLGRTSLSIFRALGRPAPRPGGSST
ncbi:MAG: CDP-alcohol phosphatidyltransferase family protein [bacterium]